MIHLQVVYRVSPSRSNDADRRVDAFVEALGKSPAHFLTYHIYRCTNDRCTLVHMISFKDREEHLKHSESQHVKSFVEDMLSLCVEGPLYTDLEEVGAFGPVV